MMIFLDNAGPKSTQQTVSVSDILIKIAAAISVAFQSEKK